MYFIGPKYVLYSYSDPLGDGLRAYGFLTQRGTSRKGRIFEEIEETKS